MKIHVIGGGPAGLYFAILMKKLDSRHEVVLFDRSKPWEEPDRRGTLFADALFTYLANTDQEIHDAVARQALIANHLHASLDEQDVAVRVGAMAALSRKALLDVLRARARDHGVDQQFGREVRNVEPLRDADLLVGADGANSEVRGAFEKHFLPEIEQRPTRYWRLDTEQIFPEPGGILVERDGLRLFGHVWQFRRNRSSFTVECLDSAWRDSELASASDSESAEALAEMFERHLRGRVLGFASDETWRTNYFVTNEHWIYDNVALLGSAASYAHFAFDHGVRRALEDAAALANALRVQGSVVEALDLYESERKPVIDRVQRAAEASARWVEDTLEGGVIDPVILAYELATRTRNLAHGELQRLDPPFVTEYERRREALARA